MEVNKYRLIREFGGRLSALTDDHYCLRIKTETRELLFAKLKHMANGNSITLTADLKTGELVQKTNGVVKYHGSFYPAKSPNVQSIEPLNRF